MKIKFPKKVMILSFAFNIIQDKSTSGGSFDYGKGEITIGTKFLKDDPDSVFMVICHEVYEAITVATKTRYEDGSAAGNWKFFFDHKEFEVNTNIFAMVISQFIP